jgi:succinate dehydrogenase/fumarate reductase flavoprotein subunit
MRNICAIWECCCGSCAWLLFVAALLHIYFTIRRAHFCLGDLSRLYLDSSRGLVWACETAATKRLSSRRSQQFDHRLVCGTRGAVRARVGRTARESFLRWRVSRTFYARGRTGQQLLVGCYQALCPQIAAGTVRIYPQTEMLDLVLSTVTRRGLSRAASLPEIERHAPDVAVLAPGGYGNVFYPSINARARLQCHGDLSRLQKRRAFPRGASSPVGAVLLCQ